MNADDTQIVTAQKQITGPAAGDHDCMCQCDTCTEAWLKWLRAERMMVEIRTLFIDCSPNE